MLVEQRAIFGLVSLEDLALLCSLSKVLLANVNHIIVTSHRACIDELRVIVNRGRLELLDKLCPEYILTH